MKLVAKTKVPEKRGDPSWKEEVADDLKNMLGEKRTHKTVFVQDNKLTPLRQVIVAGGKARKEDSRINNLHGCNIISCFCRNS